MSTDGRVFLGWDAPVLPRAADWLLRHVGHDLSSHLLITPGGRAGRLLRAALAEAARPRALSPPLTITPSELDSLLEFPEPPAGPVTRRLAWITAIRQTPHDTLAQLLARPPEPADTPALSRVAALLETWNADLAAAGYRFQDVTPAADTLPDFADAARWNAAAQVQRRYEDALAARSLRDPDLALLDAVRDPGPLPARPLRPILIGVAELTPIARLALTRRADAIALIAAPESEADRFDSLGCIRPERWGDADDAPSVPIPAGRFLVANTPSDQADLALAAIAALGGHVPAEDIIVGVPDPQVAPRLATAGRRVGPGAGIEFRPATGRPLTQTPPVTLVRAIRDLLSDPSFEHFAALVRHPDAERWIAAHLAQARDASPEIPESLFDAPWGQAPPRAATPWRRPRAPARPIEHWLGLLDRYAAQGLPDSARGRWRVPHAAHAAILDSVRSAVDSVLEPLTAPAARLPADVSRALLAVLARVYEHRRLKPDNPVHELTIGGCDRLAEAARDLARAPAAPITAPDALTLILDSLEHAALPGHPSRDSIEMLGWLELPLDPAPATIITGFNEGCVPAAPAPQPLLPERLREVLGLSTGRTRLARDAYLMSVIAHSRPHLWVIAGRRGPEGDPTPPSRLLFLCDDDAAADRLRLYTGLSPTSAPAPARRRPVPASPVSVAPMPVGDEPIPDSLGITAFACYLRCPYDFYLRYVLRAEEVEEPEAEMSPRLFGSLIHDTMAMLTATDAASSDDEARVRQALGELLSTVARERLGPRPRAAVRLQVQVARQRLDLFAPHQARRAAQGWRILHAERACPPGGASLAVDGTPIGLHGRIDRIDRHNDGRLAVLDYKTGDTPEPPDRTHRGARDRAWKDLQLPLYRHLLPAILGDQAPTPDDDRLTLGYIRLGASERHVDFCDAPWGAADLADADQAACEVVRAVRRREFQRADPVPDHRIIRALCEAPFQGAHP